MPTTKYKIAKFIVYGLAAVLLCVLQNTPGLFVLGGTKPMLLAGFAVCVAIFEKETAGGLFGVFCGMLCDLFSAYTFGFYALMFLVLCIIVGLLSQGYMRPVLFNAVMFTFLGFTAVQWSGFFFTIFIWDQPDATSYFALRLLPLCVYTAAVTPLFFYPVRKAHLYFEEQIAAA